MGIHQGRKERGESGNMGVKGKRREGGVSKKSNECPPGGWVRDTDSYGGTSGGKG